MISYSMTEAVAHQHTSKCHLQIFSPAAEQTAFKFSHALWTGKLHLPIQEFNTNDDQRTGKPAIWEKAERTGFVQA